MKDIRRILVIKSRGLGDVITSTPVITNLRLNFPKAYISFLTEKIPSEVLAKNKYLDEIIIFKRGASFFEDRNLIRKLRSKRFDLVIDLFGNFRTALITYLTNSPNRVGFAYRVRKYFYTIRIEPINPVYVVDFNLSLLRGIGMNMYTDRMHIPVNREDEDFANDFLTKYAVGSKKRVGIFPGGSYATKRWEEDRFALLSDRLVELGHRVFLFGGKSDYKVLNKIMAKMGRKPISIKDLPLMKFSAIVKNMNLFITNDTGPKYIAESFDVPTITLYGPSRMDTHHPPCGRHIGIRKSLPCSPCDKRSCKKFDCMRMITVDEVTNAAKKLLEPAQ